MFALIHGHKIIETHSTWLACWTAAKERGLVIRWPHSGDQLIPGYSISKENTDLDRHIVDEEPSI